ncbi:MAG: hypothetical protein ABSC57_10655, partial [Syntrophales bacterium]
VISSAAVILDSLKSADSCYDPFDDFEKLPEGDAYEKIMPFSIKDQMLLIESMPDHWKPYFQFTFCSDLRQGEQCG